MATVLPVSRSKIQIPRRRSELLTRARLLDALEQMMDLKLVMVAAPAGYGKTSLLVEFARSTPLPVCWLALDAFDQDPLRFLNHFVAAIQTRFPRFGKHTSAALQNDGPPDIEALASLAAREAYNAIREHFIVIIEDYHQIEESRPVIEFIDAFLDAVDENCHMVISSRTLLNLAGLPVLVMRSQVSGLSYEELAFQPEEIRRLFQQNFRRPLGEEESTRLYRETEGWITALLLRHQAGVPEAGGLARILPRPGADGEQLYEYMAGQALENQTPALQRFLLRTSLLEDFDAALCAEVIGRALNVREDWAALANQLLRRNLFILQVGDARPKLRYHPLFREFLEKRMVALYPEETRSIRMGLAEAYAGRGEWERAHALLQHAGATEELARLIERAGPQLIAAGRFAMLTSWLDELPAAQENDRPALLSLQGATAVVRGVVAEGVELFTRAAHAQRESGDLSGLAITLIRRASAYRQLNRLDLSMQDCQEVLRLAGQQGGLELAGADAQAAIGGIFFQRGDPLNALTCFREARAAYEALGDEEAAAKTWMQSGVAYRMLGRFNEAEAAYRRALEHYRAEGNLIWLANLQNNLGVLQHLLGRYEEAAQSFERAIADAQTAGYSRLPAYALASISDLYRDLDAPDEALDALLRARAQAVRLNDGFMRFYLDLAEVRLARVQGDLEKAAGLLLPLRAAAESGADAQLNLCRLESSALALLRGSPAHALQEISPALAFYDSQGQRPESLRAHLYDALARVLASDPDADGAVRAVLQAFEDPGGEILLLPALYEMRAPVEGLNHVTGQAYLAHDWSERIRRWEARLLLLRRAIRRRSQSVPLGPPGLALQTLGRVTVRYNRRALSGEEWQAGKARDFLFLLVMTPDGLSREQIGETLWPETGQAEQAARFKNTVYRLRRFLGRDTILFEDELYRFNRGLDYEYDVETFTRELEEASRAREDAKRLEHLEAALRLYQGPFLPGVDDSWAAPERARLERAYLDALLEASRAWVGKHRYAEALARAEAALRVDRCLEPAHCQVMRIYAAQNNRAALIRQYEVCRRALQEELGIEPSAQTRALFEQLSR